MHTSVQFVGVEGLRQVPTFAVIAVRYQARWLFVRHKQRKTWELPGGAREQGESIMKCAARELYEETGVSKFEIQALDCFWVRSLRDEKLGKLFAATIVELGQLPDFEIVETRLFDSLPEALTYPEISAAIFKKLNAPGEKVW